MGVFTQKHGLQLNHVRFRLLYKVLALTSFFCTKLRTLVVLIANVVEREDSFMGNWDNEFKSEFKTGLMLSVLYRKYFVFAHMFICLRLTMHALKTEST